MKDFIYIHHIFVYIAVYNINIMSMAGALSGCKHHEWKRNNNDNILVNRKKVYKTILNGHLFVFFFSCFLVTVFILYYSRPRTAAAAAVAGVNS